MRNVKYLLVISFLFTIVSCTINKGISNAQQNKTCIVKNEMYVLRLERLSEIAEDSLVLNDEIKAVAFLNESKFADTFDFEKRSVTYRNIREVLDVVQFKNQSGTKLVFQIWVDRKGDVVAVRYGDNSTAEVDEYNKSKILEAVMGYKIEPNENAKLIECGKLTIRIDNINAYGN